MSVYTVEMEVYIEADSPEEAAQMAMYHAENNGELEVLITCTPYLSDFNKMEA